MIVIGRRSARVEVYPRGYMDFVEMRILVVVGSKQSENLCHRKGKGSLAMHISQGLVGPNQLHKLKRLRKGNWLIFQYYNCMRGNTSHISDRFG